MDISRELMSEYVASQGLALFAQQKELDKLKEEMDVLEHKHRALKAEVGDKDGQIIQLESEVKRLKTENKKLSDANKKLAGESIDYALRLRSAEGSMNVYRASVERMRGASARAKSSAYGVEIISTGEYRDGRVETIVGWLDGTATRVWLAKGEENDPYVAFTAALAKKVYGSNSAIHRIVNSEHNSHFYDLLGGSYAEH